MDELAIDQPRDSANARRMVMAMMTICLRKRLIAPQTTNTVLDNNPAFGEGSIVGDIVGRAGLSTGLTTRGCPMTDFVNTDIGQIPDAAYPIRQALHQGRVGQQRQVSSRA